MFVVFFLYTLLCELTLMKREFKYWWINNECLLTPSTHQELLSDWSVYLKLGYYDWTVKDEWKFTWHGTATFLMSYVKVFSMFNDLRWEVHYSVSLLWWKESLNIDGQQLHHYQQNKPSPLTGQQLHHYQQNKPSPLTNVYKKNTTNI
jgi:hypothetical protein